SHFAVGRLQSNQQHALTNNQGSLFQCSHNSVRVRAHQTPCTKLDTTEISDRNRTNIRHIRKFRSIMDRSKICERLQHRHSSGPSGCTVVGRTLDSAIRPQNKSSNYMCRSMMRATYFFYPGTSLILGLDTPNHSDKLRTTDVKCHLDWLPVSHHSITS